MSRIISGLAGSIKLKTAAKATRPTSDRVKESVFAKLEANDLLSGARVLDLYAGTGALGLEAASRGASEVVLVEKDRAAIAVIKDNIHAVTKSLSDGCKITLQPIDVSRFLSKAASSYDVVFIDPPYELSTEQIEEVLLSLQKNLKPGSWVVVERAAKSEALTAPEAMELVQLKSFGDTAVSFLSFS